MAKRLSRSEPKFRSGLESWLVRKIHTGTLRGLPSYRSLHGRAVRNAEEYARQLLVSLRDLDAEFEVLERARDDGRSFRSWVEAQASDRSLERVDPTRVRWAEA